MSSPSLNLTGSVLAAAMVAIMSENAVWPAFIAVVVVVARVVSIPVAFMRSVAYKGQEFGG